MGQNLAKPKTGIMIGMLLFNRDSTELYEVTEVAKDYIVIESLEGSFWTARQILSQAQLKDYMITGRV